MRTRTILTAFVLVVLTIAASMSPPVQAALTPRFRQQTAQSMALRQLSYKVKVFALGTSSYFKPDAITTDGQNVYIAYQNNTTTTGSDGGPSTIVQYARNGRIRHIYYIKGHCDGMRFNPYTHVVWALVNNDANPALYTIDPGTNAIKKYSIPSPTPHGGGYDDIAFTHGMAFISASNPTLNSSGQNVFPALASATLVANSVKLTSVLYGNSPALDLVTNTAVTLNVIDPDGLAVDPAGDVVLVDQAGSEEIFVRNPGASSQSVARIVSGTNVDDIQWATSQQGTFFVVDLASNVTYTVTARFVPGSVYIVAPNDSGVASFMGTIDLSTGIITPQLLFPDPHGLIFVPD